MFATYEKYSFSHDKRQVPLKTVAQGSNVVIFLSCIIKIIYLIMWMEESQILCVAFAAMPLHMYYANKTEEMIKC